MRTWENKNVNSKGVLIKHKEEQQLCTKTKNMTAYYFVNISNLVLVKYETRDFQRLNHIGLGSRTYTEVAVFYFFGATLSSIIPSCHSCKNDRME
jgi:hypothetical protein